MYQNRRQEKPQYLPFQKKIKAIGGHTIKTHGSNLRKGDPDFVGSFRGFAFVVEFKNDERTEAEPLQVYNVLKWQESGAIAFVHWDAEMAVHEIQQEVEEKIKRWSRSGFSSMKHNT